MNFLELGGILVLIGGLLWGGIRLLIFWLPRWKVQARLRAQKQTENRDAVIIIAEGGRIHSINEETRQMFNLRPNDQPGLSFFTGQIVPEENFLNLCVNEGRDRFTLKNGAKVEIRSNHVLFNRKRYQILNLYPIELMEALGLNSTAAAEAGTIPSASQESLLSVLEISRSIHQSHDLTATVRNVLQQFREYIPAEYMELTVLDIETGTLTAFKFIGRPGEQPEFERIDQCYILDGTDPSFAAHLVETRESLLLNNLPVNREMLGYRERVDYPFNSYLGVPLFRDLSLVGTLSFAFLKTYGFSEQNRRLLETFSPHIGVAIYNAQEFEQQNSLATEQAVTSRFSQILNDESFSPNLYERLVHGISELVEVNLLGFLIYNPEWNRLEAENPFYGLSQQIVELYRVEVTPHSQGARLLESKQTLIFHQAPEDPGCRALGIDHLARAAGLQVLTLLPLLSGGQFFGYLQAAWHAELPEQELNQRLRLLNLIVKLATPAIENRLLVERSRERANRAETLQRIADSANSSTDTAAFQRQVLDSIIRLVNGDLILLLRLDQDFSQLHLVENARTIFAGDLSRAALSLPIQDPQYSLTVTARMQTTYCDDLHELMFLEQNPQSEAPQLIPFYRDVMERLDLRSAIAAPISIRGSGIGEIWVFSEEARRFGRSDLQTLQTAANHIASYMDRMRLVSETDLSLRKQVDQLTILRRVTNELSTTLDFDNLLEMLRAQAMRITGLQRATILLYDLNIFLDEQPRVARFVGEKPEAALTFFAQQALEARQPLYIPDLAAQYPEQSAGLQDAMLLLLPIFYQDRAAGMLILRSREAHALDDPTLEVMKSLAAQSAIAIGNAIQYDRQQRRGVLLRRELATIENLHLCFNEAMRARLHRDKIQRAAEALRLATPFKTVAVSLFDSEQQQMRREVAVGNVEEASEFLRQDVHEWRTLQDMFTPELRVSNSYYVTEHRLPVVIEPVHMQEIGELQGEQHGLLAWRHGEIFIHILRDEKDQLLGMVQLDCPENNYRPDQPTMDALELFGAFLQYVLRSDETLRDTQDALQIVQNVLVEKEEQVRRLVSESETLASQRDRLEEVLDGLNRTSAINQRSARVLQSLTQARSDHAAIETLAQQLLANYGASTVLVAGIRQGEEQLLFSAGERPEEGTLEPLFGQRNPLRESLLTRRTFAESELSVSSDWQTSMLLRRFTYESFISLPIHVVDDYNIALMILYPQADGYLTRSEDRPQAEALAHNLGLELSNIHTLETTQEQIENLNVLLTFSQKLASVGPSAVVDILTESIIDYLPVVEGCWVGLKDRSGTRLVITNALGYSRPDSLLGIAAEIEGYSLPAQVYRSGKAERIDELNFAAAYPMSQDELLKYREATGGMLPISSVMVPIQLGATSMGVMVIDNFHEAAAFSEADEAILLSMGQQTALVLENSELYAQALRRAEQLQALSGAVQEVSSAPLRSDEMLPRIMQQMRQILSFDRAAMWVVQENRLTRQLAVPVAEYSADSISLTELSEALQVDIDRMESYYLPSAGQADPRFALGLFNPRYESHLLLPLIARSELLGVLTVEQVLPEAFGGSETQVLQAYASQAAVSLHNALMYEESMRRAQNLNTQSERLAGLNEFALQIGGMTNLETIYEITLRTASKLLEAPVIAFVQLSRFNHIMLIAQQPEAALSFTEDLTEIPLLAGLQQSRALYNLADVAARDDLGMLPENYFTPLETRSLLIVPVVAASQFWGWMWVQSPLVKAFDENTIEIAHLIANHVAIAIVNATNYYETRVMRENLEKRVAERTHELERGLEEYEMLNNNLQVILSSMADGVLVTNERGRVVLANSAAATILNLEPALVLGLDVSQLQQQLSAASEVEWFHRLQGWNTATPAAEMHGLHSQRVETQSGHVLFVQGSAVLREEQYLGSVTILRDVTAEATAERLKSEFVTNVSHELRTPITAIKGAVEVVLGQMTGSLNQQQEIFMTMARSNCYRLQILIDDILEVSQIDAGQMELEFAPTDMVELIRGVAADYERRMRVEGRQLAFELELPDHLPLISGDPQRVRQVMENLFSNAYRYTDNGGKIITRARQRGDMLQIDVQDNGIGIPPEAASRLFERFYRGEDELVIQSAGPGLGLWITRTIVEMHGGEIWFASSGVPGEGTTFSFTLPLYRKELVLG